MAIKEGVGRVAKLISASGWIFMLVALLGGIAFAANDAGASGLFIGVLIGALFFVAAQLSVWILDGFLGNSGAESNLFWPRKRLLFRSTPKPTNNDKPVLRGVGGWLALLVVALMVLGPLRTIGEAMNSLGMAERQYPGLLAMPAWANYKIACWIMVAGISAAMIWAGNALRKHHAPSSVDAAIYVLWATPILTALGDYLASSIFLEISASDYFGREVLTALAQGLLCAAIWTAYLKRSRRVKNTYGTR